MELRKKRKLTGDDFGLVVSSAPNVDRFVVAAALS
jgi:hypothetical protein